MSGYAGKKIRGYNLLLIGVFVCFGTLILGFATELYAAEVYTRLGIQRHIATIVFWSIGLVVMFCIGLWFIWMGAAKVWKENQT